jgi:hypothetical protein
MQFRRLFFPICAPLRRPKTRAMGPQQGQTSGLLRRAVVELVEGRRDFIEFVVVEIGIDVRRHDDRGVAPAVRGSSPLRREAPRRWSRSSSCCDACATPVDDVRNMLSQ